MCEVLIDLKFVKMFDVVIIDVNELLSSVMFDGKMKVDVLESFLIGYIIGRFVVEDEDVYDILFNIIIEGD